MVALLFKSVSWRNDRSMRCIGHFAADDLDFFLKLDRVIGA
jgi:hypothetical protein